MTDAHVLLSTGAEAEGSDIPSAVPVEDVAPETQEATGGASEPMEVTVGEAAATAGGEGDDVLPEPALEVVVRSPEIRMRSQSARRQCLKPRRVVVAGSSCWWMILSTRRRWLGTWRRCARPSNG
jgi:hypothetical protein